VLERIVPGDVLRNVGREPAIAFPHDEVSGIRGIDDIDSVDVARIFLADTGEDALGAGAIDPPAIPGYLASNARAIFSASGRSTEVYQTTLPSFLAASISAGVTVDGSGAAERTCACAGDQPKQPTAIALDALMRSRLVMRVSFTVCSRSRLVEVTHQKACYSVS
jgi:hypothetical protein